MTMKKLFFVFTSAIIFVACNSNSKPEMETTKEIVSDSTQYNNNASSDTAKDVTAAPVIAPSPKKAEVKEKITKTKTTSKVETQPAPVKEVEPVVTNPTETAPVTTTAETTPVATPEKKGMSNSAKGAIIGAGAGAVGGAIISKKKGKGAIIGGLLGAGAGYIIGKKKDQKDTAQ